MAVSPLLRPLRTFFVLLLLLSGLYANAQIDNVYVYGTVKDYNTSKKLDGIIVTVFKDGAKHSSVVTSANGKYEFNLDFGYEYKLLFEKPGMVGKNVVIDTRGIPDEDRTGGLAMNMEMTLFQDIPGIDYSILQQPIGKSKYDPSTSMLAFDMAYTEQMRAELSRLEKEYNEKKKREASADAAFTKLMDQGTASMATKDYKKAVQSFTDALGLKVGDPIATAKLSDARIKLTELEQADKQEKQYADLIKEADGLFTKKSYEEAKNKYASASQVKEQEAYPKQKMKECDAFIADMAAKAEADKKAKELNDSFNAAVAAGDAAFKGAKYDEAKAKFTEAGKLKPEEKYPPLQLAAIAAKLEELAKKAEADKQAAELEASYQAAIKAGDAAFNTAKYDDARTKYNAALAIKAKEKYPLDQLTAIDKKLAELAAKAEADKQAAEVEASYQAAIKAADAAFAAANYDEARAKYNQALQIKAKEKYPTDQLVAIDKKLADLAAKADAEQKAKELEANYQASIAAADAAFQSKNYDAAKAKYNEALGFKAKEKYPVDQLAAITKALADLAKKAEEEKQAQEREARYLAFIEKADGFFSKGQFDEAKGQYQQALGVKADEAHPKERIVEIDAKLADLARQAEDKRKKDELDARYTALIASGDKKFGKKQNSEALNDYKDALQLKADEQYPKDRIAEINDLLDANTKAQAEKERLEREQQEKDRQYNEFVAQADQHFKTQAYDAATKGYNSALGVKPGEKHPTDRLAEIQALLAKQSEADSLKAAKDAAERARLAEEARLKAEADSLKAAQDAAKNSAERDRLAEEARLKAEADSLKAAKDAAELARLEAERRNKANAAADIQTRYDDAILKADAAFRNRAYDLAREGYNEAIAIKEKEKYPKDQLLAIDKAIADRLKADQNSAAAADAERLANEERLRREAAEADSLRAALERAKQQREGQQALNDRYARIILDADNAMGDKDYSSARDLYTQALDVKSGETYPQVKIEQIDKLIAEQERLRRERELAEQQAADAPRPVASASNLDNRKEQEAEEFMREAREREEVEKYGRIKRIKANLQDSLSYWGSQAATRHDKADQRNSDYVEGSEKLYQGSEAMRKRNAAELEAFREALAQRERELKEREEKESLQAYTSKQSVEADIQQQQTIRGEEHASRTQDLAAAQQAQQDRMDQYAQANKQRSETAREQVVEREQSLQSMQERQNALADRQREQVDLLKQTRDAREKQLRSSSMDREGTEKQRIGNIAPNQQRSFSDYTRNELASQYPQGVTEESYTEGNKVIIRRVLVQGNKADEYSKVIAKWGTFYFKNGQSISEQIWSVNTEQ